VEVIKVLKVLLVLVDKKVILVQGGILVTQEVQELKEHRVQQVPQEIKAPKEQQALVELKVLLVVPAQAVV